MLHCMCAVKKLLLAGVIINNNNRSLYTSLNLLARKIPHPFDGRFDTNPKDIDVGAKGKTRQARKFVNYLKYRRSLGEQQPGYYDKDDNFHLIPEMIPEFVVPDLSGFKLQPYVSYRVAHIKQSQFTARDLFDACYRNKIEESHRKGDTLNAATLLSSGVTTPK